ncbi:hypothetical protein HOC35_04490 [Candidatus Woesearchaeota archaeon]|jgi:hypothetical protein|nr:hypothetical protein [Candidatus Woesearchaeota archaeon]
MKVIFKNGKILNETFEKESSSQEIKDINMVIEELKSKKEYIHSLKIDWIIEFFNEISRYWIGNKELETKVGTLKHLADFFTKENTTSMLNFALRGDYKILDNFIDLNQIKYVYHCQPRGLVVQWLSGNVPLLGLYSIFMAMLTKNVSLIKASSKAYKELLILLESLNNVNTEYIKGSEFLETITVVLVDNNDTKTHNEMSSSADVRVAWGGHEAIQTIINLKKDVFCEDIVFGPKYSYGVIDKEALVDYKKIAQRLAFDICTFDQQACSSPHTIFVEENNQTSAVVFAEELAKNIDFITKKMLPKENEGAQKKLEILTQRAKYSMMEETRDIKDIESTKDSKVFSSENTDWTVICSNEEGLYNACFSRVIHVKPIDNISKLKQYNDKKKQTLGIALNKQNRKEIINEITLNGIDRCPRFGDMTLFESPWDGMFPIDRLVRWVALSKKRD